MTTTTPARPRVLSLSEVGERLNMKRSNVAKFLARRGVEPVIEKAQGYFWAEADIDRVKAEREADAAKMEADRRRRESALRGPRQDQPKSPELARLGASQKTLLTAMLRRPMKATTQSERHALRRLRDREPSLVAAVDGEPGTWTLTADGRRLAAEL